MELPKLPEPEELGMDFNKGWDGVRAYGYTAKQMQEYARQAVLMEREACAKLCESLIGTRAYAWHCEQAIRART